MDLQDNTYQSTLQTRNGDELFTVSNSKTSPRRGIKGSITGAIALLVLDILFSGSFLMSLFFCPIWFLVSVLKNAIERPGWKIALIRIAIPPVILLLVMANASFQQRIAEVNAPRIIAACEQFHADKDKYPQKLDDLVPKYLPSVPHAKFCLMYGDFLYWNMEDHPMLVWHVIPPFGRKVYTFDDRTWGYID